MTSRSSVKATDALSDGHSVVLHKAQLEAGGYTG